MKKIILFSLALAFALTVGAQAVNAAGGKVRGDNGEGSVCQLQENPYEYGDPAFDGDGCNE